MPFFVATPQHTVVSLHSLWRQRRLGLDYVHLTLQLSQQSQLHLQLQAHLQVWQAQLEHLSQLLQSQEQGIFLKEGKGKEGARSGVSRLSSHISARFKRPPVECLRTRCFSVGLCSFVRSFA